jgi:hypothetical protein
MLAGPENDMFLWRGRDEAFWVNIPHYRAWCHFNITTLIVGATRWRLKGRVETTGTTTRLSRWKVEAELKKANLKILESCGRDGYDMEIEIVDDNDKPLGGNRLYGAHI